MKIMAVDLGKARTGLAVCDEGELLASPLTVLPSYNQEKLLEQIALLAKEQGTQLLVVGLPLNMDGTKGESAQNALAFAQTLRQRTGLPVEMKDERGTTISAHNYLNTTDTRGKKRKAVVDAVAATIILQDYLDYRRNQRK
ncbi:MAG: Holliday junction resolvase RuvX [Oscillospiraceae bacterium]|nr:Holliday junction resolvase RuvX [Oscillospiraceae bacterium]